MCAQANLHRPIHVFLSYAHKDSRLRQTLVEHLSALKLQGQIETWDVSAGSDLPAAIEAALRNADVVLLLISSSFLASDYCYSIELQEVLEKHAEGKASVIPILLRPVDLGNLPIARLQSLPISPQDGPKAVVLWGNRDQAFSYVVKGLKAVIDNLKHKLAPIPRAAPVPSNNDDPSFWDIPYQRNLLFTGRASILAQIRERFGAPRPALPLRQAVIGLGGSGKTHVALEYAYRYASDYRAVFWIKADSRDHFISDLLHLADVVGLPERSAAQQQIVLDAVRRWLQSHSSCLLILDNLEDIAILDDLLPLTGKIDVLITTRTQATGAAIAVVEPGNLSEDEGVLLLLRRAKIIQSATLEAASVTDRVQARDIVRALGGLALALDQAGAYLEETKTGLTNYRTTYKRHRSQLLQRRGKFSPDHPEPVTTTFLLCFKKVKAANLAAAELLQLCAFLHPDAIPEEFFSAEIASLSATLQPLLTDTWMLDNALADLLNFSLIQRYAENHTLSIHRLVQTVLQDEMDESQQRLWASRAIDVVNRAFPDPEFEVWPICQQYLPHAQVCADLIKERQIETLAAVELIHRTGRYLCKRAQYAEAHALYQQALNMAEKMLGSEHPTIARILRDLGELAQTEERYAQARQYYERALAIRKQAFGLEHAETASSLSNLAGINEEEEKYVEAEAYYQQALTISEQILEPDDPDLAELTGNLARLYRIQKKYTEGERLYLRALAIYERRYGTEHPQIAVILNNLAFLYRTIGRYVEAESLLKRAIEIWIQALGPQHPNVAAGLNNLARVYSSQQDYRQAEPLYRSALRIYVSAFGASHSTVVNVMADLAHLLRQEQRDDEAEALPDVVRAMAAANNAAEMDGQ